MRPEARAVILVLLGGVLLRLVLSGEYTNYVKPFLHLPLLSAGVLLLALGAVGFVRDWHSPGTMAAERRRAAVARIRTHGPGAVMAPDESPLDPSVLETLPEPLRAEIEPAEGGHDDHPEGHLVGWLWCIPIFVLFLVPPPALGSYAAGRQSALVPEPPASTRFTPLKGSDPISLQVHDYAARAAWDTKHSLTGHVVTITGFVTPHNDGGYYVTRMKVSCCAADARPFEVQVVGATGRFSRDTWVRVTGTWVPAAGAPTNGPPPADKAFAAISATSVRKVSTPGQPYE
jgi:uncharacterized repeat protein (TIGR03943 family)